jgi:hypothetical protein
MENNDYAALQIWLWGLRISFPVIYQESKGVHLAPLELYFPEFPLLEHVI